MQYTRGDYEERVRDGDLQVLRFQAPRGIQQQDDDFGIVDRATRVGGGQPLELVLHLGALAQARGVDQAHRSVLELMKG